MPTTTIVSVIDNAGGQQGQLVDGQSTDDTTLALTGTVSETLTTSQVVAIYNGTTRLGTATVTGTVWTFASSLVPWAENRLSARVENVATNDVGLLSHAFTVIENVLSIASGGHHLDNMGAPVANNGFTDDATPTLSGTIAAGLLGAGEKIGIYEGSVKLGEAVVTGSSWSFTPVMPLSDGKHIFTSKIEDSMGSVRVVSNNFALNVDSTLGAPTQTTTIVSISDNEGNQTGELVKSQSTDDQILTLTGTVSTSLTVGQVVAIYDGVNRLGQAVTVGTSWSYTTDIMSYGRHGLTARVESISNGDNGLTSSIYDVNISSLQLLQVISDTGLTGNVLTGSTMTTGDTSPKLVGHLSGELAAGERIAVYNKGLYVGTATLDVGDIWSFTMPTLTDGSYALSVVIENTDTGNRSTQTELVLNIDTVIPTQHAVINSVGNATLSGEGNDVLQPVILGTLDAVLKAGQKVAVYDGTVLLGFATVEGGNWSFKAPELTGGTHTFHAIVEGAGTGPVTPDFVVYENRVSVDRVTDVSATPTITGSLLASVNGSQVLGIYDGSNRIGQATLNADLTWSFKVTTGLAHGAHNLHVQIEDSLHHIPVSRQDFTAVVGVPSATTTIAVLGSDGFVSDGTTPFSMDGIPQLSGTLNKVLTEGERVSIYDGSTYMGSAVVSGTSWTFVLMGGKPNDGDRARPLPWTNGVHNLSVVVENVLSGARGVSTDTVVNIINGNFNAIQDDTGLIQGNIAGAIADNGFIQKPLKDVFTDDDTLVLGGTLSGALVAGEVVAIYDGNVRLGVADITDAAWQFSPTLGVGVHQLVAVVEDSKTHIQHLRLGSFVVHEVIDITPTTTTTINELVDSSTGSNLVSGATASGTSVLVNGTLSHTLLSGEQVVVYDGSSRLGIASLSDLTHWVFQSQNLGLGSHALSARIETIAGTGGLVSSEWDVQIIGSAPTQTATIDGPQVQVHNIYDGSYAKYFVCSAGIQTYYGTMSDKLGGNERLAVYDSGRLVGYGNVDQNLRWTCNVDLSKYGTHLITVKVVDTVTGAEGAQSGFNKVVNLFNDTESSIHIDTIGTFGTDSGAWSGTIEDGGYTDSTSFMVRGKWNLESDVTMVAFIDGTYAATSNTDHYGVWTVNLTNLSVGEHVLTIRGSSFYNNEISNVQDTVHFTVLGTTNGELSAYTHAVNGLHTLAVDSWKHGPSNMRTIDLTQAPSHGQIDHIDLSQNIYTTDSSGKSSLTSWNNSSLKLGLNDVLKAGTDLFNDAKGWSGLTSGGRHQILIDGDKSDSVTLGVSSDASDWSRSAVSITHDNHVYAVYNSTDGQAQVLIDLQIQRAAGGAIV
ncbi:Ig-like domain-containing protein [Citrobacter gillenii]|uniref:Ig-like domain-containing protein n=1 Tax=Citrobacter gillenii TaxID=67828 RepID=UPI001C2D9680|nr:Ig-like domain-containing protein [Citrobacter gillenii]